MFSKKDRRNIFKLNWMKNKKYIFKTKKNYNFSIFLKFSRNSKKKLINKLIKSKRLTGLFKRKLNLRKSILKKRSFLYFFLEKKVDKKRFFRRKKRRLLFFHKRSNYKLVHIGLDKTKKMFYENRKIFNFFFKRKRLKRQHRVSKYFINFLNKTSKVLLNSYEFKLSHILIKSHFFNNMLDSVFFIKNGFILVNDKIVLDSNFLIKAGDCIRLVNNTKFNYYFFYRKNLVKSIKMSKKINWAFHKFIKKNKKNNFFPKVYNWINSSIHFGFDVPYYLEIDFVNMTVFILIKLFDINNVTYYNIKFINYYLIRLYNWSYIV